MDINKEIDGIFSQLNIDIISIANIVARMSYLDDAGAILKAAIEGGELLGKEEKETIVMENLLAITKDIQRLKRTIENIVNDEQINNFFGV